MYFYKHRKRFNTGALFFVGHKINLQTMKHQKYLAFHPVLNKRKSDKNINCGFKRDRVLRYSTQKPFDNKTWTREKLSGWRSLEPSGCYCYLDQRSKVKRLTHLNQHAGLLRNPR